jgi:outer membrane protein assembly factor BamB
VSLFALILTTVLLATGGEPAAWRQWGGPSRDFRAPAATLAATWPDEGPPRLWSRPLGDGQSAILVDEGRLYTMYRPRPENGETARKQASETTGLEAVICLDAATGATLWEHRYEAETVDLLQYGDAPRSTPLIAGDRLFTIGRSGRMLALDKRDGSPLWSHDLWAEPFSGNHQEHGYSSSAIAWGNTVIVPIGGDDASLVAFDQATGDVRWQLPGFANSHSSPRVFELAGREQLVVFMREELIGVDPGTGELLWSWPHANQWGHNITMPSVAGDTIFFSSPQAGARGLRLEASEDGMNVEQAWSSRRIQFYHATTIQNGDWVYGSIGITAPAFMTAVNIRTGEIAWRERGFAKANCIEAGGRLVALDENGVLYLAEATPEALTVLASTQLLERYAWTVPTLVGTTLYARDQKRIVAVDLG